MCIISHKVLKQGINIKTTWPSYILEFRNTNLQVYLGDWVKKETVIEKHVC